MEGQNEGATTKGETLGHCLSIYNYSCILNRVDFVYILYIVDQDDLTNCWRILQNLFETKNIAQTLFLLNKHHILCMDEGFSIVEFMCNIKEVTTLLGMVGEIV